METNVIAMENLLAEMRRLEEAERALEIIRKHESIMNCFTEEFKELLTDMDYEFMAGVNNTKSFGTLFMEIFFNEWRRIAEKRKKLFDIDAISIRLKIEKQQI